MRARLRGINTARVKRPDGTVGVYYYHRASGKRLIGAPGTPEFLSSLAQAETLRSRQDAGTLAGLIRAFENSPEHRKLAQTTKDVSKWIFGKIEREYGDMTLAAIEEKIDGRSPARVEFLGWHEKMAKKSPRGSDNTLAHLARVLSWAKYRGDITENPIATFHRAYAGDRSDIIWLPEHIEAFTALASPELCCALMLALHTGQRQGDLRVMPWSAYDGKALTFRQGKGKRRVYIPCTKALREMLDGMKRRGPLIMTTARGRAWKKRNLNDQWSAVSEAAELGDLHFHDLRGTAVTMLAEAGCTVPEIAAITGHSINNVEAILEKYLARTRVLAENAIAKLEIYSSKKDVL